MTVSSLAVGNNLTLDGGSVRTIFLEAQGEVADGAVAEVARLLNERLGGRTLAEIRSSLSTLLRDGADRAEVGQLHGGVRRVGDHLSQPLLPLRGDRLVIRSLAPPELLQVSLGSDAVNERNVPRCLKAAVPAPPVTRSWTW